MGRRTYFIIASLALILVAIVVFLIQRQPPSSQRGAIQPRVLIISMFQLGDPLDPASPGEATSWVQQHQLNELIAIPGAYSPLYCNASRELCLVISGVGAVNASMTMMALGLNDGLDLSRTYLLMAGIAGVNPNATTVESVAWADWVVDSSISGEFDSREAPPDFEYPRFPYGCDSPDCAEPYRMGSEVFEMDPLMLEWGYSLTKDLKLSESAAAKAKKQRYEQATARSSPSVLICSITGGNTWWHGKLFSGWAEKWVQELTGGKGEYCMTAAEEPAVLAAVKNLGKQGRFDPKRMMLIRVGSNFDQPHPGQTPQESLHAALTEVNSAAGMDNLHLVGWTVVETILTNWEAWRNGPPKLP